jgi:2-dehydropantoate 2-reductase
MNIAVLGAGAVGGYFGGRLASKGNVVTFLVRERRYRQLQNSGLNVKSIYGDFTIAPRLALSSKEIENPEVVIVALKNYHLESAFEEIRQLVRKGAKVLPLLNGVQHMDTFISEFGTESVLGGLCYIESTLDPDGNVVHTSRLHDIVFGSLVPSNESLLTELEESFKDSGVNVRLSPSIMVDMWQKFIFLTSFSGITAAIRKPIGEILNDTVANDFLQNMIHEIISVAKAKHVKLPTNVFEQVINKLRSISPSMTSSLHRDLENGLPLEIDSLQGAVLDMAKLYAIQTPCVRSIYALLHPYKGTTYK